jgi:hypothetical protein
MQCPPSAICVLCGAKPATTRDHLPPRGFFKGLQADFITVPACADCNQGGSSDDEDMRFFLSMQVGKQPPGAASLWNDGALKSVKRKTSLREQVITTAREVQVTDPQGFTTTKIAVLAPARIYDSVFGRITRGLYFFHTGRILDTSTPIQVAPLTSPPDEAEINALQTGQIADGAFSYWFGIAAEEPTSSLWVYRFYGIHWVHASTGRASDA